MAKFNMTVALNEGEINAAADDAILESLMNDLDGGFEDEIIEAAPVEEHEIEALVADIEKAEAIREIYAQAEPDAPVNEADAPKTEPDAEPKAKKAKVAKKAKEPKEPKEERVTRVGNKESKVLQARLGVKASEFLLLEVSDAELDAEKLSLRQAEILAEIDQLAVKVGEKATMLFGWMAKGGKLNEVLERTFKVLARDGELTSGVKGNLQVDLLGKPYSPGTAASQANQMFMLLPALKITMKEKGRMVANPDSLILMKAKAELGLA